MDVHKILARLENVAIELGVEDDSYYWELNGDRIHAEYHWHEERGPVHRHVRISKAILKPEDAMEFEAAARKEFGK